MADTPTPRDPWANEGNFNPQEQQTNYPSPQTGGYPAPQQPEPPASQGESYPPAQQAGYPQPAQEAGGAGAPAVGGVDGWHPWSDMSLLGLVAGVAGLLLLIFFFLPWSFTPDTSATAMPVIRHIPTTWHSGWSTASGLPLLGGTVNFTLFPQLWLVLVSAIALIALGVLLWLHQINLRLAAILITLISLFALLLEILFLIQINSFQAGVDAFAGGSLRQTIYGVSWGFWVGLAFTVVALGVGLYLLFQELAPGAWKVPQAPRIPRGQQPYPTT